MPHGKIINLPTKRTEAITQEAGPHWIVCFTGSGAGYCHFGYNIGEEKYPWVAVIAGRTHKEAAALIMKVGERLKGENKCISMEVKA